MVATGSIPTTSIHGTWLENVEVWSVEDDTLLDLSSLIEVSLKLRCCSRSGFDNIILTMSNGGITLPAPGIIQWRAEVEQMRGLESGLYEVILLLEDETDTLPLIVGTVSIVE